MEIQALVWFCLPPRHERENDADWSNVSSSTNEYDYHRLYDDILQVSINALVHVFLFHMVYDCMMHVY